LRWGEVPGTFLVEKFYKEGIMKKILVVDDEKLILKLAKRVLEKEGYQVNTAGAGKYAQALCRQIKFGIKKTGSPKI